MKRQHWNVYVSEAKTAEVNLSLRYGRDRWLASFTPKDARKLAAELLDAADRAVELNKELSAKASKGGSK